MGKKKKLWLIPLIASGVVIIAIAAIPLSMMFQIKSNQKELKKSEACLVRSREKAKAQVPVLS